MTALLIEWSVVDLRCRVRKSAVGIPVLGGGFLLLLVFIFLPERSCAQETMLSPAPGTAFVNQNSIHFGNGLEPDLKMQVGSTSSEPAEPPPFSNPPQLAAQPQPGSQLWSENFQPAEHGLSPRDPQDQQDPSQPQKKEKQKYSPSTTNGSPGHIFWVIPAFKVNYQGGFKPLTAKEKFQEWAQGAYDPLGLGAGAVEAATLEYSSKDGFCGYGGGWGGYGQCFGSLELDANVSSFIGDYALIVLLHQGSTLLSLGQRLFSASVSCMLLPVSSLLTTTQDAQPFTARR